MNRINKVIELLENNQPVYYTSTREMTYENGLNLSKTWADYIRLDLEHGPFDMAGLRRFMDGLVAGGLTKSGHRTPTVIAELPMDALDGPTVMANAWMIKQVLAQGVHGILLCHCESPSAVTAAAEYMRYSFQSLKVGQGIGVGRRGNGAQEDAAFLWGISELEYLTKADLWPLNPEGELLLGLKIENQRALENAEASIASTGVAFAEWGPGDMGMSMGYPQQHDPPYPENMLAARRRVMEACRDSNVYFLNQVDENDIFEMIDEGVMICRALTAVVADKGRKYTKRQMSW